MRQNFLSLHRLIIALCFYVGSVAAVVQWNGSVTTSVTDQDINVQGTVILKGGISVQAINQDIKISVHSGDAVITGDPLARLYVCPNAGRTISFVIDDNLQFKGTSDGTDLLFLVGGAGTVEFIIKGGKKVSFTSTQGSGGVQLYVLMKGDGSLPTLLFRRKDFLQDLTEEHVEIVVGARSVMSFIAPTTDLANATEVGAIVFDPSNFGSGRMALRILDGGSVVAAGHKVADKPKNTIELSNIDRSIPAGLSAAIQVINSQGPDATAGLFVLNFNEKLSNLLADPWCTKGFNGVRWGFVVGANGVLDVGDLSYLDYVGLAKNVCPQPEIPCSILKKRTVDSVVKERNPSALIVDGNPDEASVPAQFKLGFSSAIFFRSGIDRRGVIREKDAQGDFSFVINPNKAGTKLPITQCAGNIVLAVEGQLDVIGSNTADFLASKLEILSLQVGSTGGPVFITTDETNFPKRTFNKDVDGDPLRYNSASFFINNRMNLFNISLEHTDENHVVIENDDEHSEPAYVGGDTFKLKDNVLKPELAFYNSIFALHTSVAVTGFNLVVPNSDEGNFSDFIFYQNGKFVDRGSGRNLILGTQIGSFACDCCTVVSRIAHLDISADFIGGANPHQLSLLTASNTNLIVENIDPNTACGAIDDQFSIQTIYLGWTSNIFISANDQDEFFTNPCLYINGNYFSFESRGGCNKMPDTANTTGKGGIFVYENGKINIESTRRASFAVMVTKSKNGIVDLPKQLVFFDLRVGIADAGVDLTDPNQRILVKFNECFSDYTLNWRALTKDWDNFCPYDVGSYNPCSCPPVLPINIAALPTIQGTVDQLQIQGSRIGDPAHIFVDGGWVRELVFLSGNASAQAPTGVVVLQNNGRVGLGSAHRDADSLEASIVLGVNGVTIIANGDGQIDLNEDLIINNICHILAGPDFGFTFTSEDELPTPLNQTLTFHSDCCRSIIVKAGGVLDLSSFLFASQRVLFGGNIQLVLEPGAKVILSGPDAIVTGGFVTLAMANDSSIVVQPVSQLNRPAGTDLTSTDDIRVKILGIGNIVIQDDAAMYIDLNGYVGVETDDCFTNYTSVLINLFNAGKLVIGRDSDQFGGSLQVGNTVEREGSVVEFGIGLFGIDSAFELRAQGFLGFGVGIVNKTYDNFFNTTGAPNEWLVDTTFNVLNISITLSQGVFKYQQIAPFNEGDQPFAALMAFGPVGQGLLDAGYTFTVTPFLGMPTADLQDVTIAGGGNIVKILPGDGPIHPIVLDIDGVNPDEPRLTAGLLMSLGAEVAATATGFVNFDVNQTFDFFKTPEIDQVFLTRFGSYRASVGRFTFGRQIVGYIDGGKIVREIVPNILNSNLEIVNPDLSLKTSVVALFLNGPMGDPAFKPRPILVSPLYGKQVFQLVSPNV